MTRQRMAANGRAGVSSTGAEGGKREELWPASLTPNSTSNHNPRHAPGRRILRCPSCGASAYRFDVFAGPFGDSPARCAACFRRSPRRDWLVAA